MKLILACWLVLMTMGGNRPHLGFDTQWYLMGDTLLEQRRANPNNLMSPVVVPGKGHTAWNQLAAFSVVGNGQ